MQLQLLAQYVNAAHAANQQGQHAKAVEYSQLALALSPGMPEAWFNLGIAQARLGQKPAAISSLEQARLRCMDSAVGLNSIGLHLLELGALEAAETCLRRALELAPQYAYVHSNLGKLYSKKKQPEAAMQYVQQALALAPNEPLVHVNLAGVHLDLKQHAQAEQAARQAIAMAPSLSQAWEALGLALAAQRRFKEAGAAHQKSLTLNPGSAEAWATLGALYGLQSRPSKAETAYRKALELNPEKSETWAQLGLALQELKRTDEALICLRKAYDQEPDLACLLSWKLIVQAAICDWADWDAETTALVTGIRENTAQTDPLRLTTLLDDPQLIRMTAERYSQQEFPGQQVPVTFSPRGATRVRVGYFSSDFRDHPVGQLLVEMLECHDRTRFEILGFALGPASDDALSQRIAHAFDRFIHAGPMSDPELIAHAREQKLDIAINLNGYTAGHRNNVFAHRIAPVQVNYLGYPGTMGAEYMDYLITDSVVCPPGSEAWYSEKLARLQHSFMPHDSQQAISEPTPSRSEFELPTDGVVFCCFNKHVKISPEVFDLWMRVLQQVEGSVLWLSDGSDLMKNNLRREATARKVDPARLVFARRVDTTADHLARLRLADLFLDTLPYNAHTTALDALWAGVPVLTQAGQCFASRVAASLLHTIGLSELVTESAQAYEKLAVELALSPLKLQALQKRLAAQRLTAPLFNTTRLTRDIERLYSSMHARAVEGLAPDHISLEN